MSNVDVVRRSWPPECCVPAFLHSAMVAKNFPMSVPDDLPKILGVRVARDQDNPLGLALADDCNPPGIRAADAEREINQFFSRHQSALHFRHVPFLEVELGLWEDTLDEALSRKVVVGLGVDFGVLRRRNAPRSANHILRVLSRNGEYLEVVDDSGEATPTLFRVTIERAGEAVFAIPDGFWMIGHEQDLHLPFTLHWEASH